MTFQRGPKVVHVARSALAMGRIAWQDFRVNMLGQLFPLKPRTLNLLVNDICNSHCQMCRIWQQKREKEYTPAELAQILRDPLFAKLSTVSVSGGEPTLRRDLPEIYRVLAEKRPRLRKTTIFTNALYEDDVIARITASALICRRAGVAFQVVVSLDGLGAIHDLVRGCAGNYDSARKVIRFFRDKTDIPVSIGCTITKDNLWHVDHVLDFCRKEGIRGRFRVADFIRRLDNAEQSQSIRNFDERETYHLGLFFAKLERTYEKSASVRRIYKNIRRMLLEKETRSIGCLWQARAVTLNCRGYLSYCAPRSPELGNCSQASAHTLYRSHIRERKEILQQSCDDCIHDYPADETLKERIDQLKESYWRRYWSLETALARSDQNSKSCRAHCPAESNRQILVVGWYGIETAGDKAILDELIHRKRIEFPQAQIVLASLHPYYSQWTLRELGYPDIPIVPIFSSEFNRLTRSAGQVIMGGGPLLHVNELGVILRAFDQANRAGHQCHIFGCGIGPLEQRSPFEEAVRRILKLADVVELRDSYAVARGRALTGRQDLINSGDPAARFVKRWQARQPAAEKKPFLNLYLREWTSLYKGALSAEQFTDQKQHFWVQLGEWIRTICNRCHLRPRLLPMHHFYAGGDDRDFGRRFARILLADLNPLVVDRPLSLDEILSSFREASFSLCMRYHAVLFAQTLKVPFVAIDYTQGGKIAGFLSDCGAIERMISLADVVNGQWANQMNLLENDLEERQGLTNPLMGDTLSFPRIQGFK